MSLQPTPKEPGAAEFSVRFLHSLEVVMKLRTKLRLIGGGVLMFNLWIIGQYNVEGIPALLLTLGFAIGYECLIVRPVSRAAMKSE